MRDDHPTLTVENLQWLRFQQGDPAPLITALLGVEQMAISDHLYTHREVLQYLEYGDEGAARALLQHAKGHRESWKRKLAERE